MTLKSAILLIVAVYILGFATHTRYLQKTVYGDGVFYYSWLRSLVVDHDINFTNEYAHESVTQPYTLSGIPGNKYSIGPALLWSPAYISTHQLVRGTGWELPYQVAVGATSVAAALCGIILLSTLLPTPPATRALTLLIVAGSTNLLFYGSLDTVNSHALSFFCAVVYLVLLSKKQPSWLAIGITLALLASVRLQDLIYILFLIPLRKNIQWTPLVTGFAFAFLPQLAAWYFLYGTLTNPYIAGGETFDLTRPHILGVLFGPQSGLFLWTPMVAVGLMGLFLNTKKYWLALVVFTAQLYMVASWSTWWQGASVSGRMFVSTLPLVALGLSEIVTRAYSHRLLHTILPLMILGISALNLMGIFYYVFTY